MKNRRFYLIRWIALIALIIFILNYVSSSDYRRLAEVKSMVEFEMMAKSKNIGYDLHPEIDGLCVTLTPQSFFVNCFGFYKIINIYFDGDGNFIRSESHYVSEFL